MFNPITPKIWLVILLYGCYAFLFTLLKRIWRYIMIMSRTLIICLLDNVFGITRRSYMQITSRSQRVKKWSQLIEHCPSCTTFLIYFSSQLMYPRKLTCNFFSSLFGACWACIFSLISVGVTLFVLNFVILERQYFAGFYIRDLNRQLPKKDNKFRYSSFLNFI